MEENKYISFGDLENVEYLGHELLNLCEDLLYISILNEDPKINDEIKLISKYLMKFANVLNS